jgi:hypothetical protein
MSRGYGKGKSAKRFSYSYEDLSKLLGCSVAAVRKHAQRGNFDPNSLPSVLEFVRDRLQRPALLEMADSLRIINKLKGN